MLHRVKRRRRPFLVGELFDFPRPQRRQRSLRKRKKTTKRKERERLENSRHDLWVRNRERRRGRDHSRWRPRRRVQMGRRRLDDTIFSSLSARRRQSLRRLQLFHHEHTIALGERWRRDGRRRRRRYSPEAFSHSPPEKRSRSRSRSPSRRRRPNCSLFQLAVGMHHSFDSSRRHDRRLRPTFRAFRNEERAKATTARVGGSFCSRFEI